VAYIPNFAEAASNLFVTFQLALLVAFCRQEDSNLRQLFLRCKSLEDIYTFVHSLPERSLIFVFDQFNSIDVDSQSVPDDLRSTAQNFVRQVTICVSFLPCTVFFFPIPQLYFLSFSQLSLTSQVIIRGYSANNVLARSTDRSGFPASASNSNQEFSLFGGLSSVNHFN
jgi:hypothetical protein